MAKQNEASQEALLKIRALLELDAIEFKSKVKKVFSEAASEAKVLRQEVDTLAKQKPGIASGISKNLFKNDIYYRTRAERSAIIQKDPRYLEFEKKQRDALFKLQELEASISPKAQLKVKEVAMGKFLQGARERLAFKDIGGYNITSLNKGIIEYGKSLKLTNEQIEKFLIKGGFWNSHVGKIISRAVMTVPIWMLMRGAIQFVTKSIDEAIKSGIRWEAQMAKIKIVSGIDREDKQKSVLQYRMLSNELLALGSAYGTSIEDLGEGATLWAQQGKALGEIQPLMESTIKLSILTGKSIKESVEDLTAVIESYKISANETGRIIDAVEKVELKHAITTDVLTDALKRVAPVASQMGVSFEGLLGIITATHVATRATGQEIGNAWKSIFVRIRTTAADTIQSIAQVPIYLDEMNRPTTRITSSFRNMEQVLNELAIVFPTLNTSQQSALLSQLAMQRQVNYLTAAFQHWQEGITASIEALNSVGTADSAINILLGTTEAKLKQLNSTWAELGAHLVQNGELFKFFFNLIKDRISMLDDYISLFTGKLQFKLDVENANNYYKLVSESLQKEISLTKEIIALKEKKIELDELAITYQNNPKALEIINAQRKLIEESLKGRPNRTEEHLIVYQASAALEEKRRELERKSLILEEKGNVRLGSQAGFGNIVEVKKQTPETARDTKEMIEIAKELNSLNADGLNKEIAKIKTKKESDELERKGREILKGTKEDRDKEIELIKNKTSLGYSELQVQEEINKLLEDRKYQGLEGNEELKRNVEIQIELLNQRKEYNREVNKERLEVDHVAAIMKLRGEDEEAILKYKLAQYEKSKLISDEEERAVAIADQRNKIDEEHYARMMEYSDKLKENLAGSIKNIMAGTGGMRDLFKGIQDTMVESYRTTVSDEMAKGIMNIGGFGEMFGKSMLSLKGNIEVAHKTVYDWIVKGHKDGIAEAQGELSTLNQPSANATWQGSTGGIFSNFGMFNTIQGGGIGGTNTGMQEAEGIGTASFPTWSPYSSKTGRQTALTGGQKAQIGIQSAMTGYSAYQSARAGGISPGQSIASGLFTGVGSAMMAGSMATAIAAGAAMGPVGWIGLGIMAVGMALGMFGGKKSTQTQVETKTTENAVSSKIDVTNKNLEVINRNLIALRTDIRTYILPASAYFSEKRNLDDEYSIMSRRGYQG